MITPKTITNSRIEKRINRLKEKLSHVRDNYHYQVYLILSEILLLRQQQIKNYKQRALSREIGINMNGGQIAYIFGFKYFSKKTKMLVRKRIINPSTPLCLIKKNAIFRDHFKQDNMIEKILEGRVKMGDITLLNKDAIKSLENGENIKPRELAMRIVFNIKEVKKKIYHSEKYLTDPTSNRLIKKVASELAELTGRLK